MARRKRQRRHDQRSHRESGTAEAKLTAERNLDLRRLSLLLILGVMAARPLVPTVTVAQQGQGSTIYVLWLLTLLVTMASCWRCPAQAPRLNLADWLVLSLFSWYGLAAVLALSVSPRPAVNMGWHWVGMGASYLAIRLLSPGTGHLRLLLAAVLGVAVAQAAIGVIEYAFEHPADVARYERVRENPQALQELTGQWLEPGSQAQKRFEDRLYSNEPTGTQALTNSLAGLLAPAAVMLCGMALLIWAGENNRSRAGYVALTSLVVGILILTKSRSGWIAAGGGVVLLFTWQAARRFSRRHLLAVAGTAVVLALVALLGARQFDRRILTQAGRSFSYRWEYWQATLGMIRDHPLYGCGPGQFQETYTRYKLPGASEEVADPHNFLFEVVATAGMPAAFFMVAALAAIAWRVWSTSSGEFSCEASDRSNSTESESPDLTLLMWGCAGGILAGNVAAWIDRLQPSMLQMVAVLLGTVVAVTVMWTWIQNGSARSIRMLSVVGMATSLVHLSASGGISEGAVGGNLWILAAILVTVTAPEKDSSTAARRLAGGRHAGEENRPRTWAPVAAVAVATALIAAIMTGFRPVVTCRGSLVIAEQHFAVGNRTAALPALQAARNADRLAVGPERLLAEALAAAGTEWVPHDARMLELAPRASGLWFESARRFSGSAALDRLERACELYPTNSVFQLRRAELLRERGAAEQAAAAARAAIRSDDALRKAGHEDKVLTAELREKAVALADLP